MVGNYIFTASMAVMEELKENLLELELCCLMGYSAFIHVNKVLLYRTIIRYGTIYNPVCQEPVDRTLVANVDLSIYKCKNHQRVGRLSM